jgi:hypothetical protein
LEKIKGDILSCVKSLTVVNIKKTTFLTSNLLDFMAIKTLQMRANEQSTKILTKTLCPILRCYSPVQFYHQPYYPRPSKGLNV